jgi:rare lipoprotein A
MRKIRMIGLVLFAWASLISVAPTAGAREAQRQSQSRAHQFQTAQRAPAAHARQQATRPPVQHRSQARTSSRPQLRALARPRGQGAALRNRIQASRQAARQVQTKPARGHVQRGRASYYASGFHGQRMANGHRFNRHSNSAASRTLPLGTRAQVRNLDNGQTARVVIDDRGPHSRSRVLDVSPAVASRLGMRHAGTARVEIVPLVTSARAAGRAPD